MRMWLQHRTPSEVRQAGFSLIEIVVGLALFSFAVALMPGSIRLGLNAWSARSDLERNAGFAMVLEALQERIEQALPIVERGGDGSIRIMFAGDAATIEFVGTAETGPYGAGVYRNRISPTSQDDAHPGGLAIAMHIHVLDASTPVAPVASEKWVLAGDRATFRFRYFGASNARAGPGWHETWRRDDALPLLVEINAELRSDSQIYKRRLVVAMRTAPHS